MVRFLGNWGLFLLLNLLAGYIAAIWAVWDAQTRKSLRETITAWVTLFLGIVIGVQVGLGLLGLLYLSAELVALFLLLIGSVYAARRHDLAWPPMESWRAQIGCWLQQVSSFQWRVVHLAIAWTVISLTFVALAEPSTLIDTYSYHLPAPITWARTHTIQYHYLPWSDLANTYFPGNGELLYLWALYPFFNDLLVRLVGLAFFGVLGIGLYRICRTIGVRISVSLTATYLLLFTPLVFSQATDLMLDMASAAVFLLAFGYLLRFHRTGRTVEWILFSLACGVFTGMKFSGATYLAVLSMSALVVLWWLRKSIAGKRRYFELCAIWFVSVVCLGGTWYIRNWLATGNPLYPTQITLGTMVLFEGPVLSGTYAAKMLWQRWAEIPFADLAGAALQTYGWIYSLSALSAIPFAGWRVWRIWRAGRTGKLSLIHMQTVWLLLLAGGGALFLYLHTPYSVMLFSEDQPIDRVAVAAGVRFSLVGGALLAVYIAAGLSERSSLSRIVGWGLLFAIAQCLYAGMDRVRLPFFPSRMFSVPRLAMTFALTAILFAAWLALKRNATMLHPRSRILAIGLFSGLVLLGVGLYGLQEHREYYRYAVYRANLGPIADGWAWVSSHTSGSKIAVTGMPLFYGLFGRALNNEARYVNIVGEVGDVYHNLYAQRKWYRDAKSPDVWFRNLATWGANYYVADGNPNASPEREWVQAHPELFEQIYKSPEINVYRVTDAIRLYSDNNKSESHSPSE